MTREPSLAERQCCAQLEPCRGQKKVYITALPGDDDRYNMYVIRRDRMNGRVQHSKCAVECLVDT